MTKFKVSDTITIKRTWIVEAKSEYGAIDQIDGLSRPAPEPDEEEQIDNTPYEAVDDETNKANDTSRRQAANLKRMNAPIKRAS